MKKVSIGRSLLLVSFFVSSLFFATPAFAVTAPTAPVNVLAVAGDGSAAISFSVPSSDGGSPIKYYTVALGTYAASPSKQIPATPLDFLIKYTYSGLTNGTPYVFYVTATNDAGTSPIAVSGSVTPKVAGGSGGGPGGGGATPSGGPSGGGPTPGANTENINLQFAIKNPLGSTSTDLPGFIANVLSAIVDLLFPVVVIMLLYSGFLFVISRGNIEKLGDAKKALMYTVIGAAIVLGASGLAHVIQNTISAIAGK